MKIKKIYTKPSFLFGSIVAATLIISGCSKGVPEADKNAHIYFGARTMGPSVNIYSVNSEGMLKRVTDDDRVRDLDMDITASGRMAFSSNRKDEYKITLHKFGEKYNLFTQSVSDLEPKVFLKDEDSEFVPRFSPDEQSLAFLQKKEHYQTIMLAPASGDKPAKPLLSGKQVYHYDWSPDGKKIVVGHSEDDFSFLSVITLDSGKIENLLTFPTKHPQKDFKPTNDDIFSQQVVHVSWSPDGKNIAYIRSPMFAADRQLRLYNIETKTEKLISRPSEHAQDHIDWSSNGQQLLYSALIDYLFYFDEAAQQKVYKGGMQVLRYSLDGKTTQLTNGDHLHKNPTFSPSEQEIAFFYADRLDARTYQLKKMKSDGSNIVDLFDGAAPEGTIVWQ